MDNERCKGCKYYKCYYHGFGVGTIMFSNRCWWGGKDPADMKEEECPLTTARSERTMEEKEAIS